MACVHARPGRGNLKAEIDEELIETYHGTVSAPFELGDYRRVVAKMVDDRGIESLKVIAVEGEALAKAQSTRREERRVEGSGDDGE